MVEFTRRKLMATSVAASLGASVSGVASAQEDEDGDTENAPYVQGEIERLAHVPLGAEMTGPFVTGGMLIFSVQHPSRANPAPWDRGSIGYIRGHDFDSGDGFDELSIPTSNEEQGRTRVASGEFEVLAAEGDNIANNEDMGMPQTPDGLTIDQYEGSQYGDIGYNPDMNQFVATGNSGGGNDGNNGNGGNGGNNGNNGNSGNNGNNGNNGNSGNSGNNGDGYAGYLFTNFENSPGNVTRTPIVRNDDGSLDADLDNAINLANTDALRDIGGTRINCYGDLTPWNTPVTAEEEYAHTRVSGPATVGDIVDQGTGVGLRGAAQFWNRPNPSEIIEVLEEYYGDDSWTPQGFWALGGVELQAYYLGADPVDQEDGENVTEPIGEGYPNPYRTGYVTEFQDPTADQPTPVKYYVGGRAAWEAPDFQADEQTVYLSSDGANKGFYKLVTDEPITSYDDPMDISGTLHAAKVTNQDAAANNPPAEVNLEIEWMELGSASNAEVESWIAEYDDVDQRDYLGTHAETDWEEDLEAAIEEADQVVAENGNQNYVTDQEIVDWASQYESEGPDGVDEELRRVPFIETRTAAKEIGATVEFRKSEGIDSIDGAGPGDYIYLGISEVNDGMSDDVGDVQVDRVDGGLVYRAEIEDDHNISTLEPVIVGPDGTDPADVADDALLNIDNVYVMDDGRVLCCEDASQYGRSYPNDCMHVYTPE
jgi:secreted PhoX family phosphatase